MSFDLNNPLVGSAAAAPTTNAVKVVSNKDSKRQRKWFDSGVRAKQKGYSNTSPFYENVTADYFFKCGFDGVAFEEAQNVLTEKIKQVLENNPLIDNTLKDVIGKGFNEMLSS